MTWTYYSIVGNIYTVNALVGTGRVVRVLPLGIGTTRSMEVNIHGYYGPPPEIQYEAVGNQTVIPVKFCIVCDANGQPPTGVGHNISDYTSFAQQKISEINKIWSQAGVRFQVDPNISVMRNTNAYSCNQLSTLYSQTIDVVFSELPSYSGIKVYVNEEFRINRQRIPFAGTGVIYTNNTYLSYGTIIPAYNDAIVWAHEFGHICGLDDIYWNLNSYPNFQGYSVPLVGSVSDTDIPDDIGYYAQGTTLSDIIVRLLMFGFPDETSAEWTTHTDIPLGKVYGLQLINQTSCSTGLISVGLTDLNRSPTCVQLIVP